MLFDSLSAAPAADGGGRSASDARKLEGDLNRFLTLLVTQLQNQDPLEPLDANEFTSQLVQFASVEQQIYQNANLEKLLAAQQSDGTAELMAYLDQQVEAAGPGLPLQDGTALGVYTLPEKAIETTVTIRDGAGRIVRMLQGGTAAGRHEFVWDGTGSDGRLLPDGVYSAEVRAVSPGGKAVPVTQGYFGRVTGISVREGKSVLDVGGSPLPPEEVIGIRRPPPRPLAPPASGE